MITPIETLYAGCRFRSRLEARWACFLDRLRIVWEYEPQGYEVGPDRRPYLPDFWLPRFAGGTWVEVKGSADDLDTSLLADAVGSNPLGRADHRGEVKILILGPVPEPARAHTHAFVTGNRLPACIGGCAHDHALWAKALIRAWPLGEEPGAEVGDWGGLLVQWGRQYLDPAELRDNGDVVTPWPNHVVQLDPPVRAAYKAARTARFEHGEAGAA